MRRSVIATGSVLALLALSGCAGSSKGSAAHQTAVKPADARAGAPAPGVATDQAARIAAGGTDPATSTTRTQPSVTIGPAQIITAELTLRAKSGDDVSDIARRATDLVTATGGGLTGDRRTQAGSQTQADLTLKVPPQKYQATLEALAKLGKELSRSAQAEDVTDQVVDVASRVSSQEASVARIRKLLSGARSLGDVVQIEGELAKREADLESLKARQRALDAQTSFATITLHVRGPAAAVSTHKKPARGFTAGLAAGWRAFTAATGWLLTAIGALLPFLILAAAVLAAVTVLRRRRQPRPHPSPSPDPAAAG